MRITASSLSRARACLYWARPEVPHAEGPPDPARALGNAFHACAAAYINGRKPNVAAIAEKEGVTGDAALTLANMFDGWKATRTERDWIEAEAAFAYDPTTDTARRLGREIGREYAKHGAKPHEICGSADVVIQDPPDRVVIQDFKTGRAGYVERAETNVQLRGLALSAARTYGATTARIEIHYASDTGTTWIDGHDLDELDLDAMAAESRGMVARVPDAQPVPGQHCHWCPAAAACPATAEAIQQALPLPIAPHALSVELTSPEHAAWTLHRLRAVREACDAIEGKVREYADANGPIPTAEGKVWGRVEQQREAIECSADALELMRAKLGSAADDAVKVTTSKAAIARAAKATGNGSAKQLERDVLDGLRACGAVKVSAVTKYEERSVKA
jgi:RecB family exonuclease